jgi:hypothetical protein
MSLDTFPIIPAHEVSSIKWTGNYVTYDTALYALGESQQHHKFVILNPDVDPKMIKHIKSVHATRACTVWYYQGVWIAKMFTKGWNRLTGYLNIELELPIDVIFISYFEPNAEENWQRVLEKAPGAKRVNGVTGILEAHKAAAELANTDMFYVVDGDAYLTDDWTFDFQPSIFDRDAVYVWYSQNPVNGLTYGYGGVKLFPTALLRNTISWNTDLTTGLTCKLNIMEQVSNITKFDTSDFSTWRSAFRECAKLASGSIDRQDDVETQHRLDIWRSTSSGDYGKYSCSGADAGYKYGIENKLDIKKLKLINNQEWLRAQFKIWNTNTLG